LDVAAQSVSTWQPLGDALNIAMEPVATYSGNPTILALVNFGSGLPLIASDGRWEVALVQPGSLRCAALAHL
jgi:hypothetical protein